MYICSITTISNAIFFKNGKPLAQSLVLKMSVLTKSEFCVKLETTIYCFLGKGPDLNYLEPVCKIFSVKQYLLVNTQKIKANRT